MPDVDRQKCALVVGASRGLGLGLSLELLKRGLRVTATVRGTAASPELTAYGERVKIEKLDINDLVSVASFVDRTAAKNFDLVFINAGVTGPLDKTAETVSPEEMAALIMTNAVAPVRLAIKLLPRIKPGTGILAFMSSILGSVESNSRGVAPLYSASKAALNSLTRSLVAGLTDQNITVLTLHPGWVRTDMGGPNADIDVATSVSGLANVLAAQAGAGGHRFLDYTGKMLPW
jgi:NAD(P)-dependent dehydrogenase (short-subunit alcohol dehydrogenase family)